MQVLGQSASSLALPSTEREPTEITLTKLQEAVMKATQVICCSQARSTNSRAWTSWPPTELSLFQTPPLTIPVHECWCKVPARCQSGSTSEPNSRHVAMKPPCWDEMGVTPLLMSPFASFQHPALTLTYQTLDQHYTSSPAFFCATRSRWIDAAPGQRNAGKAQPAGCSLGTPWSPAGCLASPCNAC